MRLLGGDSAVAVRKTVLTNIGVTRTTLPHIMARLRDVSDEVRKHAFKVIAYKVEMRALSIQDRNDVISLGLGDRSPVVQVFRFCLRACFFFFF